MLSIPGEYDEYRTFREYAHSILAPGELEQNCESCGSANVPHQEEIDIRIPETCRFLAIEMGLFGSDNGLAYRRNRTIGNPNQREKLFGKFLLEEERTENYRRLVQASCGNLA